MLGNRYIQAVLRPLWFMLIGIPERFIIARNCLYGDPAIFDVSAFSWAAELESHWKQIRQEAIQVLRSAEALPNFQDLVPEIGVTDDDRWKTYFLYGYGHKVATHCLQCPETTRLIEAVPGMTTAFFSILYPHKHLPAHRGPYKGFLRYHLGLVVLEPRRCCRIRIGNEVVCWEEGKSLLFDDTREHEVWNDTDGIRVVLFLDVVRPLPHWASIVNRTIIRLIAWSPPVRRARHRQTQWIRGKTA